LNEAFDILNRGRLIFQPTMRCVQAFVLMGVCK
jgi:hypothetical protein